MKSILTLICLFAFITSNAQAVVLGPGQGYAEYNPLTGQVFVSSNGAVYIVLESIDGQSLFLPANAIPYTSVPNAIVDTLSTTFISYLTFNLAGLGVGDPAILDSLSVGSILPTGITSLDDLVPDARFRWAGVGTGNADFTVPIHIIPEPSSFILAGIAGIGLLIAARRRRVA